MENEKYEKRVACQTRSALFNRLSDARLKINPGYVGNPIKFQEIVAPKILLNEEKEKLRNFDSGRCKYAADNETVIEEVRRRSHQGGERTARNNGERAGLKIRR